MRLAATDRRKDNSQIGEKCPFTLPKNRRDQEPRDRAQGTSENSPYAVTDVDGNFGRNGLVSRALSLQGLLTLVMTARVGLDVRFRSWSDCEFTAGEQASVGRMREQIRIHKRKEKQCLYHVSSTDTRCGDDGRAPTSYQ